MKSRAQLDHVLLDVDFFDKPKARALLFKFGPLAQLYLIKLYAALSRATNAIISQDAALGIAWELRIESGALEILDFCISEEMLERVEGGISSARVAEDQEKLANARERWRKSKGVHEDSTENPRGTGVEGARKCELLNTEDLNTEDLKSKKETVSFENVVIPDTFDRVATVEAVTRWAEYVESRFKKRFYDTHFQALLARYATKPGELVPDIHHSISSDWANIRSAPKDDPPKSFQRKTNFERNMEILGKSNERHRNQQNPSSPIRLLPKLSGA